MRIIGGAIIAVFTCAAFAEEGPGTFFVPKEGTANVTASVVARPGAVKRTVAFLGGSITEMNGFRPLVMKALRERHPDVDFAEIAAGLSSTCSDAGAFRMEEDVFSKGVPDLLVVDAAVNDDQDGHFTEAHSIRGMEGIVRNALVKNPSCAVVVALMVNRQQFNTLMRGEMPCHYVAHAKVAKHYGVALADVGSALAASAKSGGMGWAEYCDCHPSPAGCKFGAKIVMEAVERVFDPLRPAKPRTLPPPIDEKSYFGGRFLPFEEVRRGDGWEISRPDWESIAGNKRNYFTQGTALWSERSGAELDFSFRGTATGLFLTAGPDAGDIETSVDGGPFVKSRLRADYGALHYPYVDMIADGLDEGLHNVRLRIVPSDRGGTAVRIHRVCVNSAPWTMFDRRLGMFVHWGIYSVGEWHEQEQMRREISRADYEKFMERFTAEKFRADDFVEVAESAGAEYIVITAKHHDGFCMWDTATTDYKVTNTPARRDVIKELAEACRRRGMKLGFYYSNPDWHHPNAHNAKSTHQLPMEPDDVPDMEKYIVYVKAQVTELLSNYGEIVCFFWDIPTNIDLPEMDALVRRLQPGIMVNDRGWGNKATCDYSTPERDYEWDLVNGRHIESCDSVGVQSWGYRADEDYHTHGYLTRNIDRYLSTGANFLLNVGPKADGTIPDEVRAIMVGVGKWYGKVSDSFRNVKTLTDLKLAIAPNAVVTRRDDTLFVHFPTGLDATGLDLRPLTVMPERATLLNTGKALNARVEFMPWNAGRFDRETLHVWGIPADDLANECVVIRLDFAPGALRDL